LRQLLTIAFVVLLGSVSRDAYAQKQLILLKGQKVILRLYPGDEIELKMRGNEDRIYSYVNNLYDTALVAHETLIPYSKIERIYFTRPNFMNKIGSALIIGGVGYFLIDQLNTVIVQGEDLALDENVTKTSVIMVGVGLPMMLIKKKSQRMKAGYHLLTVEAGSPFYKRDINHMAF
jgi:hypothetical protein